MTGTALPTTEALQAASAKAAMEAALTDTWPLFEVDEDPGSRPDDYVEMTLVRRFGGEVREHGGKGTTGWRLLTRYVSRSYLDNVRAMRELVRGALEETPLVVGDETTTPVEFETGEAAGDDEGWFSALDSWTWTF